MFGGWRSSSLNKLDVMYLVYIHLGIGHLFYVGIRGDKAKQSGSQGSEVKWSEWTGTAVRSCGCFDAQAHHIIIGSYSKGLFNAAIQIRSSFPIWDAFRGKGRRKPDKIGTMCEIVKAKETTIQTLSMSHIWSIQWFTYPVFVKSHLRGRKGGRAAYPHYSWFSIFDRNQR